MPTPITQPHLPQSAPCFRRSFTSSLALSSMSFAPVLALALSSAFLLGTVACGPGPATEDSVRYEVSYKSATTLLDKATWNSILRDRDPDGTWHFDSSAPEAQSLAAGDVIILEGLTLAKVTGVTDTGSELLVATEPAALTDAIEEGQITWDSGFNFDGEAKYQSSNSALHRDPLRYALDDGTVQFSGKVKGFDITLKLTPAHSKLNIEVEAKRELNSKTSFSAKASGYIERFRSVGHVGISGGALTEWNVGSEKLRADIDIEYVGVETGLVGEILSIPLSIKIPIELGPIPGTIALKANLSITSILNPGSESHGKFSMKYSGSEGLALQTGAIKTTGTVENSTLTLHSSGSASTTAAGLGFGVEFPRVELAMIGDTASVYITLNNAVTSVYTSDPACQQGGVTVTAFAGAKLNFFGLDIFDNKKELWKKDEQKKRGNCDP